MPRLYRIILPVSDVEQAAAVYSQLLDQPGERVSPGRHYFNCDGTILACYDPAADGDESTIRPQYHPEQYVYIAVKDLGAVFDKAQELGFTIVDGGIQTMPWGETMFWCRDPFRNPVSFVDERQLFLGSA